MIDSGATALFLGKEFVNRNNVRTFPLKHPIQVFNINGTENRAGRIEKCARLKLGVDEMNEWVDFLVTDLGGEDVILGLPWLREHNPKIDWRKGQVGAAGQKVTIEEVLD
jgi:predicted aspartyl protease